MVWSKAKILAKWKTKLMSVQGDRGGHYIEGEERCAIIWKEREGGHDMEGDGLTSCKTLYYIIVRH